MITRFDLMDATIAIVAALIRETNGGVSVKESVEQAREYLRETRRSLGASQYNL